MAGAGMATVLEVRLVGRDEFAGAAGVWVDSTGWVRGVRLFDRGLANAVVLWVDGREGDVDAVTTDEMVAGECERGPGAEMEFMVIFRGGV